MDFHREAIFLHCLPSLIEALTASRPTQHQFLAVQIFFAGIVSAMLMLSHNSRGFESASKRLIWIQNAGLLGTIVAYFAAFIPLSLLSNKKANFFMAEAIGFMERLLLAAKAAAAGLSADDILGAPIPVLLVEAAKVQEQRTREMRPLINGLFTLSMIVAGTTAIAALASLRFVLQLRKRELI